MRWLSTSLWLALAAFAGVGCATSYSISTKPAKVKVYSGETLIGETPVTFSSSDTKETNANGAIIRLEKEGYRTLHVWVPRTSNVFDLQINMNPLYRREAKPQEVDDHSMTRQDLNRIAESMLNLQANMLLGQPVEAEFVKKLLEANPALGSAHFLAALAALKESKKDEALLLLKEAVRFAPQEFDFLSLYNEANTSNAP